MPENKLHTGVGVINESLNLRCGNNEFPAVKAKETQNYEYPLMCNKYSNKILYVFCNWSSSVQFEKCNPVKMLRGFQAQLFFHDSYFSLTYLF